MKMKILLGAILFIAVQFLSFGQESNNSETKKVAILETVDREGNISYGIKLMLRSSLSYAITNTPGYEGYDRVDLASIVGEHNFQRTGLVSDAQIRQLGEMTGASYILVAEAAKLDETHIFITAKILNVETAKLEHTANVQTLMNAEDIEEGCTKLASMLFGTEAGNNVPEAEESSVPTKNGMINTTSGISIEIAVQEKGEKQKNKKNENIEMINSLVAESEANREIPYGIHPGMKYKEYRKLYNSRDYVHILGDRYSPVVGGVCSFLVPGLGQMICGEIGRGFAWFGGTLGSYILIAVGSNINSMGYYTESGEGYIIAGSILTIAGIASLLGIEISSIIDGVKVAKIKNMYQRDLVRQASSVDVSLLPYISTMPAMNAYAPSYASHGLPSSAVAGMSLRIRF